MNILKNKIVSFAALLICNAILFSIIATLLHIRFEVNDDIFMCLIANGNFSGIPDYHLVFQNALWGCLISSLYTITKSIEWYSVSFVFIHIVAISIIVFCIIHKRDCNKKLLALYLICVYSLWIVIIQSFQFTTTAGLLCIAGCILLLKDSYKTIICGVIAILISSLIRFEAAALVGLLFAPLFLITYKRNLIKYVRLLCILLLVFSAKKIDMLFYETQEWKEYYEYNKFRGEINDNPNMKELGRAEIMNMGISQEDYDMLCDFIPDPQVITMPIIKQIDISIKSIPVQDKISNIKQLIKYRIPLIFICLLTFMMALIQKTKFDRYIIILWGCLLILLLSGICLDNSLKSRVFLCAITAMIVFYALVPQNNPEHKLTKIIMSMCIIGICAKYNYQCYKERDSRNNEISMWEKQKSLLKVIPENSYLVTLSQFPFEGMSIFHIKDFHTKLYPTGWQTLMPLSREIGGSHACMVSPNIFFFASNKIMADRIKNHLETKYYIYTEQQIVTQNEQYSIIQLQHIN